MEHPTDFSDDQVLHQPHEMVPPSRGSTFSRQGTQHEPAAFSRQGTQHEPEISSDKSSNNTENEHLPPLVRPPVTKFRHYLTNGDTHGFHSNNNQSPTTPSKKYITKTMTTNTTIKKAVRGGPVLVNGNLSQSSRTTTSESSRTLRRFWWSPQRNDLQIRTDGSKYQNVSSRIGSLANIQHQPGGGRVAIRDERTQWQAAPKVGSLANANWSPPPPRITVRKEKVKWDANSKVGSMVNIDHKPAGGNVAIRDDKMDLSHITPRVDCGFLG